MLAIAGAVTVAVFVVFQLRLVVLPVVFALFLTTILQPPKNWLRRRGLPGALATAIVMLMSIAALGGLLMLVGPPVADEVGELGVSVREGAQQVSGALAEGPFGITEADVDSTIDSVVNTVRENTGAITQGVLSGAVILVEVIAGLLLVVVLLFFFLKDGERIWFWVVDQFPAGRTRVDVSELGLRAWGTLVGYIRGLVIVATVDSVLIGTGLAIVGVPLVLPLAVLTFFSAFFPLVGAFTAGLIAALVALVSNGLVAALIVVAIITAVQQIEGDVLYPVVVGRAVRLHPVAILLAITAGGVLAGILGALLAPPFTAVAWTVISYLRKEGKARAPAEQAPPIPA